MIRLLILAPSAAEEAALAAMLAEDDRLEIVDRGEAQSADVVLVSGNQVPAEELSHIPTVILTGDVFEQSDYRTAVRARLPATRRRPKC